MECSLEAVFGFREVDRSRSESTYEIEFRDHRQKMIEKIFSHLSARGADNSRSGLMNRRRHAERH